MKTANSWPTIGDLRTDDCDLRTSPKTVQNLGRVLSQHRRRQTITHRHIRKPDRICDAANLAQSRVLNLHNQSSSQCLRVAQRLWYSVNRRRRNATLPHPLPPRVSRFSLATPL